MAYSAINVELFIDHPVYQYKAGAIRLYTGAVELPTVSSADNGKVLTVANGAWTAVTVNGGGGGSSSSGLLVTVSGSGNSYTCDKTAGEIYDALVAGINPVFAKDLAFYPLGYAVYANAGANGYVSSLFVGTSSIAYIASGRSDYPHTAGNGGGEN